MANPIDLIISFFDPDRGLRRMRSRTQLQRAYEGASQLDGWRPRRAGASANADHRADATTLRGRARALVHNVPYIASGMASLTSNLVGTGITPRSLAKNKKLRDEINRLWAAWVKVANADGPLGFYGMQAAAHRAMKQDGEVLIRLRSRRESDGLPVPLQLQLLEIDWLDSWRNQAFENSVIINGIEYDQLGKVIGYWLFDHHPGEAQIYLRSGTSSRRVDAANIIHLYNPERPGQGRGVTTLAPVVARVRDLQLYEDAELQRKNLETRLSVLASGDISQMANAPELGNFADPAVSKQTGNLGPLASGSITEVPAGTAITVVEPKAAPGYAEYVNQQLHLIAAGLGATYEAMTGDVSQTNFSSARVRLLDLRRMCEQEQWLVFIPMFCERIWVAFIDAARLGGKIPQADYSVEWSTPKWDYVNPEQDVKADLAEISGGLSSISEKLRRRGYDPEQVFTEIKSDFERLQADGIMDLLLMLQKGRGYNEMTGQTAGLKPPA